jgi:hypothetical protein
MRRLAVVLVSALAATRLTAQVPAHDPSATLQQVLPPDVAAHVLQHIADARSRQLPAAALEQRALELAAKGVAPPRIDRAVAAHEAAMAKGKRALQAGGRRDPSDAEVDAAGTAVSQGVDGAAISALASSAPSGRSLSVPITVMTSLLDGDRNLNSSDALERVLERLQAHASDEELSKLPQAEGLTNKPGPTGQGLAATRRPDGAGPPGSTPPIAGAPPSAAPVAGPPVSVPKNGGSGVRPSRPGGRP